MTEKEMRRGNIPAPSVKDNLNMDVGAPMSLAGDQICHLAIGKYCFLNPGAILSSNNWMLVVKPYHLLPPLFPHASTRWEETNKSSKKVGQTRVEGKAETLS